MLDVLADDFGGPYDAVFANAVLLHVERGRLERVLRVAAHAVNEGGILAATFKKGDGEGWSDRKLEGPRYFTYWREEALRRVLASSGWSPLRIADSTAPGAPERWITVLARAAR
ncbi:hypothetical protein SPF06_09300 [Sinomonas sp. JGH33]|uniref:Methyltransferase type 11 domain-containing protein n=1 Tax=Sinomonas terricola TaxID=3110330 RepID=A0ABU5T5H7_9MICC|nr:hypothetical protein [Sinomonas sp. JGH33]MEA5454914.1 hypothetical protein [Sinomonas sp. JGH33]